MNLEKHVSDEEVLELTKKAFENNQVPELLCGEKGYSVDPPEWDRYTPSNIPTDIDRVLCMGIYALYLEKKDPEIIRKFREAIITLNHTPVQIWCAYRACWSQMYEEHSGYGVPFEMIDEPLLQTLRAAVLQNEAGLRGCKEWLGIECENGLWDFITRVDSNIEESFGVSIL